MSVLLKLFIGGFIPGIIMGVALIAYSYYIGKKRNYIGRDKRLVLVKLLGQERMQY